MSFLPRASATCAFACLALPLRAETLRVATSAEFRAAVAAAKPGTRIVLAPGEYAGGFHFANLRGEPNHPIQIVAADLARPPVFSRASTGLHLSNPAYVELHALAFAGLTDNGLNIDDGGDRTAPAHHIVLDALRVKRVGPSGNHDGIKLSGVTDFRISTCTIEAWGDGGSAIDMVGCHRGTIEHSRFHHRSPEEANGVQCKGGTTDIVIRRNRFEDVGGRGVNIGGSTGWEFFRPPLAGDTEHAEARAITVEGNTFIGGTTAVAFVGVDGAIVRFNTIERPARWALRILQENRGAGFTPCRGGEFTDNVVIFDSAHWFEGGVNIGGHTQPTSFVFARNWWLCRDRPEHSAPRLPTPERDGVYGKPVAAARSVAGADALN